MSRSAPTLTGGRLSRAAQSRAVQLLGSGSQCERVASAVTARRRRGRRRWRCIGRWGLADGRLSQQPRHRFEHGEYAQRPMPKRSHSRFTIGSSDLASVRLPGRVSERIPPASSSTPPIRDAGLTDALAGAPVNTIEVAPSNANDGSETGCASALLIFLSAGSARAIGVTETPIGTGQGGSGGGFAKESLRSKSSQDSKIRMTVIPESKAKKL